MVCYNIILWLKFFEEEITINKLEDECKLKPIGINSKDELEEYFNKVRYEACEYSFMTIYMWQHVFNTSYMIEDGYLNIFGRVNDSYFAIQPITEPENYQKAFEAIEGCFNGLEQKLILRAVTKPWVEYLSQKYPDRFEIIEERDSHDYFYEAEKLRTLSGRKYHSKKNHYNSFLKEYGDRFEYRRLGCKDFPEAIALMERWAEDKEKDQHLVGERLAVEKVFKNYPKLTETKVGGIYIDNNLEAFTFGELLNPDTVVVHVEKANPEIRGLYAAINKLFLENEFPDVEFVNREEDLGLEGLRQAKLSYKPIKLVEKYTLIEK